MGRSVLVVLHQPNLHRRHDFGPQSSPPLDYSKGDHKGGCSTAKISMNGVMYEVDSSYDPFHCSPIAGIMLKEVRPRGRGILGMASISLPGP